MIKNKSIVFLLLWGMLGLHAAEYQVDKNAVNMVKFFSEATVESFTGSTAQIDGYVLWNGDDPTLESELYFEVPLTTIDTGIGLRNRHMRDNYLHTDQFPLAIYTGKLSRYEKQNDSTYDVLVEGKMKMHGEENPISAHGTVIHSDKGLRVTALFAIKLTDFKIKIPQLMFMKISETIRLEVDFHLLQTKP
jgi:polyisoprenoid-binding protein YceI